MKSLEEQKRTVLFASQEVAMIVKFSLLCQQDVPYASPLKCKLLQGGERGSKGTKLTSHTPVLRSG